MKRAFHLVLGMTLVVWTAGCQKSNPRSGTIADAGPGRDVPVDVHDGTRDATEASEVERSPEVGQTAGCAEGTTQACSSPGNPLVGACHAGVQVCANGVWGGCSEVVPAAQESCNGIDDNCNGMVDEGCAADCLVVCASCAGSSDAAGADGSLARPFTTLAAAVAALDGRGRDGGTAHRICVAGGTSCSESFVYQSATPLTMRDRLIVQGGYAVTATGLVACTSVPRPNTTLEFKSAQGVVFDASIVTGAELSGFVVSVVPVITAGSTETTVAVEVSGARQVSLARLFIDDGLAGRKTYGVRITVGGQVTIIGSSINGGQGQVSAVGVYVNDGVVNLRHNCDNLVAGRCTSNCSDCGPQLGIRGHVALNQSEAPAQASAVHVSQGAGSSVVGNMICGGSSAPPAEASPVLAAAMVCEGSGCSTVSWNAITGGMASDVVGLALLGSDPLVAGNRVEGGCGTRSTTGVWLESSSAKLQNNRIQGGRCLGTEAPLFYGMQVKGRGAEDNPDVHSNDIEPLGLPSNCESVGLLLERSSADSSASGSYRNNIIAAGACPRRTAVGEATGAALQPQVLAHNDLYDPAADFGGSAVLYHGSDGDAVTAAQVNARPGARGNISVDPQYVASLADFHLMAESACIDRGGSDQAPADDAEGNPRPSGAGYDIGAYEFQK